MTTNDIEKALKGIISWAVFCKQYSDEKMSYMSRNDGALTSVDLNIKFDLRKVVIEKGDMLAICLAALEREIDQSDVGFIASTVLLSGFDFADDDLEDICHLLSDIEKLDDVKEIKSALEV